MNIDLKNKDDAALADAASKNAKHYKHACSKHKLFAHYFALPCFNSELNWELALKSNREILASRIDRKVVSTYDVLTCEFCEIYEAYERGDIAQAREEIRDAIAVLERMDDWLIAEQKMKVEAAVSNVLHMLERRDFVPTGLEVSRTVSGSYIVRGYGVDRGRILQWK